MGFYIIDNLPTFLFRNFLEDRKDNLSKYNHTAVTLDTDSDDKVKALLSIIEELRYTKILSKILFIDADTHVLLQRFSETRRPHPIFNEEIDRSLEDTIERERSLFHHLRAQADVVIDTSTLSTGDLKDVLASFVVEQGQYPETKVFVNFTSFGFKYGLPRQCDLLIDVRFIKNPFFIAELKEQTGLDQGVYDYVINQPEAIELREKYLDLLNFLLPKYLREGKSYVTVCIGCTGGKHRSVTFAEAFKKHISMKGFSFKVTHRDIDK
jgi:RNase adapter protein RapZ